MILKKLCRDISVDEGYEGSILKRLVGLVSYFRIFESTPNYWFFIFQMASRFNQSRTSDTYKVKEAAIELLNTIPVLSHPIPFDKDSCGFNHVDTGRRICPANIVHNFDLE